MGTRSLTIILDEERTEICVLYRQYDGYPTGHGAELKNFLSEFKIVNGYGSNDLSKTANGMGCLAAQIIGHFKSGIGGFYLYPAESRDCGEEYIYTVYKKGENLTNPSEICLKIQAGAVTFFGLPGTKQNHMPVIYEGPVNDFEPETIEQTWSDRQEEPINDFIDDQILSTVIITPD